MLGLLSQPKPQSADSAIVTLCDRISHSLLIEDRKAAILSLRGLAHENRELVASMGLQGLFEVLIKDSHDLDAAKATLETLLILFNTDTRRKVRNKRYISPLLRNTAPDSVSEPDNIANDISLWLTDRLLHSEDALNCILKLTTTSNDPFTAVYALQLISVMVVNRPVEAKQAMLVSGGVSPLVTALGSVQEMVRDEALLVLSALTVDHLDLQKLVTFEGGFDKTFDILRDGGGVVFGGRFAEDCLSLLANLIEYNTSNQKLFTQSGYVSQWTQILQSIVDAQNEDVKLRAQAVSNIEATMMIGQLLCVPGAEQTKEHQDILCSSGALTLILQIALSYNSPPAVRVAALVTAAALVHNNVARQDDLLAMDVPYYDLSIRKVTLVEPPTMPVSQALLNWAVNLSATHLFDLRCASLICLGSAFSGNTAAKIAFVGEQIDKYSEHSATYDSASTAGDNASDETQNANIIEVLAEYSDESRLNPFRVWFASAIVMRLFVDAPEVKSQLQKVSVGDESLGMEVHSLIQAISGEMQGALRSQDPTIALGYVQLLCHWAYDDPEAVNELTRESSAISALLAHQVSFPMVESLSVILLGIAYTFCSKDSPLPRKKFHELLTQTLGRDQYMLLIRKFRQSSYFQNFEESSMFGAPRNSSGSPAVYLDASFVDLMRESIGYISRAIDSDPEIEPSARLTHEMHDEIKAALHTKSKDLEEAQHLVGSLRSELEGSKKKLDDSDTQASEREKLLEEREAQLKELATKLENVESVSESLREDLTNLQNEFDVKKESLTKLEVAYQKLENEHKSTKASQQKAEEGVNNLTRELFQLQRAKESLEKETGKLKSELSKLNPKLESAIKSEKDWKRKFDDLQSENKSLAQTKEVNDKLVAKLKETAAILKQSEEEEEQLRRELSKIKLEAESNDNEVRSLRNREAAARKEVELAKSKVESLKKEVQNLTANNASTNSKEIGNLQSTIEALKKDASEVRASKESCDKEIANLKSELQKAQAENQAAAEMSEKTSEDKQSLESANEKLKEVNVRLMSQIVELKKNTPKEVGESSEKSSPPAPSEDFAALKSELEEKQSALDELMILLDDLTEKKSSYKNRLRDMKEDVSDSDADGDDDDEEEEE